MSDAAPTSIPPYLVHTVFQYILPPSLPLPPHLLSRNLAERHHFLSISASDTEEYLCWPSEDASKAVDALEHGQHESEAEYHVRYTAPDLETLLAHVQPNDRSQVQIVFSWDDETRTWKYHDTRLMPFPKTSFVSLEEALAQRPRVGPGSRSASPLSDGYWDGYGSEDDSQRMSVPPNIVTEDDEKAEAAYWASYGAVQGSGDSTIPSPKPLQRLQDEHGYPSMNNNTRGPETMFDPFVANLHLKLQRVNGFLSPHYTPSERGPSPEPEPEPEPSAPKEQEATQEEKEDDCCDFPHISKMKMMGVSGEGMTCMNGFCTIGGFADFKDMPEEEEEEPVLEEDKNEGLRDAVRGLYRMWKTSKSTSSSNDTATFLSIVKDALDA